jgi:hypothetical protein
MIRTLPFMARAHGEAPQALWQATPPPPATARKRERRLGLDSQCSDHRPWFEPACTKRTARDECLRNRRSLAGARTRSSPEEEIVVDATDGHNDEQHLPRDTWEVARQNQARRPEDAGYRYPPEPNQPANALSAEVVSFSRMGEHARTTGFLGHHGFLGFGVDRTLRPGYNEPTR